MWILLKRGEKHREGDQLNCGRGRWYTPCEATWRSWDEGNSTECARRNLTGWEAVKYALETEVLGNDKEGCETTRLFWDCECDPADRVDEEMRYDHIHQSEHGFCPHCHVDRFESSDSRKAEVIMKIIEGG